MKWLFGYKKRKKQKKVDVPLTPVKGYEPYSWTDYDIEQAKYAGWTNIIFHKEDDGPFMAGTISGTDPEKRGTWYVPKARFR